MPKFKFVFRFYKQGMLIFIGHLDLMRLFHRVFQQSGLPVSFSEGFNPHPRFSLPFPIAVGYEGREEIGEVWLDKMLHSEEIMATFNAHLPPDIQITSVDYTPNKTSLAALPAEFEYKLSVGAGNADGGHGGPPLVYDFKFNTPTKKPIEEFIVANGIKLSEIKSIVRVSIKSI